jgi:hypothetical protein
VCATRFFFVERGGASGSNDGDQMSTLSIARPTFRMRLARIADGLAIAIAMSLPWSTSATIGLIVFWLLALVPTLDPVDVRREIATPAGGWPIALIVLGGLGMAWADVSWAERLGGFDSFFKLLIIPLLFIQFRRSDRGLWVMVGYLASCTALLAISSTLALWPRSTAMTLADISVPVKSATTQIYEFVTCIFALLFLAIEMFCRRRRGLAGGMMVLALVFLTNVFYLATTSTDFHIVQAVAVVIIPLPLLFVLLGFKKFNSKGMLGLVSAGATLCIVTWVFSPHLRYRTAAVWENIQPYPGNDQNWAGERPEFWKKSLSFIGEAPVLGHGTGSVHKLFVRSAIGQTGVSAMVTTNPFQQTFAVGIQIGLVGVAVLWAMWISQLLLFRGNTLPEWIGLVIVTQNLVGSLMNSYLFSFSEGWIYVFGVGVAGGMVRRLRMDNVARAAAVA